MVTVNVDDGVGEILSFFPPFRIEKREDGGRLLVVAAAAAGGEGNRPHGRRRRRGRSWGRLRGRKVIFKWLFCDFAIFALFCVRVNCQVVNLSAAAVDQQTCKPATPNAEPAVATAT